MAVAVVLMGVAQIGIALLGLVHLVRKVPQTVLAGFMNAIAVLVLTQGFNLVFVPWIGVAGLALSIGLGALVNATWLLWGLKRLGSYRPSPGWLSFGLRVVLGCAAMGVLQWQLATRLDWIALGAHEWQRALAMAASLGASALVYFAVLLLVGVRPAALGRPSG